MIESDYIPPTSTTLDCKEECWNCSSSFQTPLGWSVFHTDLICLYCRDMALKDPANPRLYKLQINFDPESFIYKVQVEHIDGTLETTIEGCTDKSTDFWYAVLLRGRWYDLNIYKFETESQWKLLFYRALDDGTTDFQDEIVYYAKPYECDEASLDTWFKSSKEE